LTRINEAAMRTRSIGSKELSMKVIFAVAAFLAAAAMNPQAMSQQPAFPDTGAAVAVEATQAELDQLLAPVALYPDGLLADVLAASTYPLEVVALKRWLERNPNLTGDALEQAIAQQPWDASVKALAPFGSVVAMMNGELEWMQRVGNAFLADEAQVMDAVQRLRRKAREAGALADNARERVVVQDDMLAIEPVDPEVIYVPVYDPRVVYGSWGWPGYPPYMWSALYFGPWDFVAGGIAFGIGIHAGRSWFDRPRPDWRNHNLLERRPGGDLSWRHDPIHRGGVAYPDPRTRDRFGAVDRERVRDRQDFRGFDVRAQSPAAPGVRPPGSTARPAPTGPSALAPVPRENARQNSQRGRESLGSPRAAPASRTRGTR
jgi:hypothetical protein